MKHGETVSLFERELAAYCGAKYAIAAANGTVTLQAALVALGVTPGNHVSVPPLTHAATTIAVLNVGAVPVFTDVEPDTWLMGTGGPWRSGDPVDSFTMPVSLYGLHWPLGDGDFCVDDAAQTLRKHDSGAAFTSLSFQASKILSTGEGGALLTDSEELAERARSYLSLGYRMSATQARIDSGALKSPTFDRHHSYPAINGRMNDATAQLGLNTIGAEPALRSNIDYLVWVRQECATYYWDAIAGCAWMTPQFVPQGWTHDYWTFAVACDTPARALWLADAVVKNGGERPYPPWRLTYDEPAFRYLDTAPRRDISHLFPSRPDLIAMARTDLCPVAESLQPRLLQFQTNDLASAETNARALRRAIEEAV